MKSILSLFSIGLTTALLAAQDATVTVLHGVPGLAAPVQVFANNNLLFAFDYGDQQGPLSLSPGSYALEVRLNGAPILSANATLNAGDDVSVIAHLDAGGAPRLALFANDVTPLTLPASRLTVRHTAQAPAVDVELRQNNAVVATINNLSNGSEAIAPVPPGRYAVSLLLAGTSTVAFGPVDVAVENGVGYGVFAVGNAGNANFTLLTQRLPLAVTATVVHGIPGLPAPVTVRANSSNLFAFDFREVRGPLVVNPGAYTFDVVLNGAPVLSRNDQLSRGDDVTLVAHLDAAASPVLSAFVNDTTPTAAGSARVAVRHLAAAPAVDVVVTNQGSVLATIPNLSNGQEVVTSLPIGNFEVSLRAAGTTTTVFGPVNFRPQQNLLYEFIAVGDFSANTFGVELLQRDLSPAVPASIQTRVGGWGCGPTIASTPSTFEFGEPFELTVTGGAANAMALVNFGDSITSVGPIALPLALQPIGAPGCFLNTNVLATLVAMTDAQGDLRIGYVVPRALAGVIQPVYFQVGVASNSNSFGWVTTQYLELF